MRIVIGIVLVVLVGAALYWYVSLRPAKITNVPSYGTDIIALGDSLVAGQGADPGKDFVSQLSQKIGKPIVNLGVPGNTTADGLARVNELDRYHPKVVLLLLGGNDYLKRVPPQETFANLGTIIEDLQARGAAVLLLGVRGGVLVDHFKSEFETLRDTYHTAYVSDVLSGLIGHNDLMSDEIHPNSAGYGKIADRVYPVLMPLAQ